MAQYLVTARNAEGSKVTERVDADSADKVVQILRERGYDEIDLHTDDVGALYTDQKKVEKQISPRQYLWFRNLPSPLGFILVVIVNSYKQTWVLNLAALAALVYRQSRQISWGSFDTALLVFLLFPIAFALLASLIPSAGGRYHELIDAVAWGRWDEVLARADSVGGGVAPDDIAFHKANALAALGRLDEGLAVVKPFLGAAKPPAWIYWIRLSDVYLKAKKYEDAYGAMEKALQIAPDNATVLIDAGGTEVRRRRNPKRARELLERARKHALSDTVKPFATELEGLIALEEKRYGEAEPLLKKALADRNAMRFASPLIGASIDRAHAYLALAAAGLGDIAAAEKHFGQAKPRLVALGLDELIERCEKAIGLPAGG
jgi:tetratricopeptide (TPR) repeat protein